jgi:argininosuccinate lyase
MFLFSNPMLGLIKVPSSHAGTSSIMPHKRNPATLEIVRAELSKVVSAVVEVTLTLKGLPSGYCLDLQQISPSVWDAFKRFRKSVVIIADFVREVEVGDASRAFEYPLQAADLAEYLSVQKDIPFRESYRIVAESLKKHNYDLHKVKEEVLKGEELPEPITSRRNLGSPGNWDVVIDKIKKRVGEMVKFINEEWERTWRCSELLTQKVL